MASCCVAAATLLSASSRFINPNTWVIPAFIGMVFPVLMAGNALCALINIFVSRRTAALQWLVILLSVNALADYSPINYPRPNPSQIPPERLLKVMTYNVCAFYDNEGIHPDGTNRTASQIIASGADIVTLQEAADFDPRMFEVTQAQADSVNEIYPYCVSSGKFLGAIYSKTPLRQIHTSQPQDPYASWVVAETEVKGIKLLVISVHLQSLGLTNENKYIYHELTNGETSEKWVTGYKEIYHKLDDAFRQRANQAAMLAATLDSLNYENVLVCGDFNDISGCYAQRRISRNVMHSAYTTTGFGPMVTYNNNRFYFHIDHILYEGRLRALEVERGNLKSSDHYPLYCVFEIEK